MLSMTFGQRTAAALTALLLIGGAPGSRAQSPSSTELASALDSTSSLDPYETALAYVSTFYPLWFTYYQSLLAVPDQLIGPLKVTPAYQVVVAINVDTLYASSFLDLSEQPAILTIPPTDVTYSALTLDPYGDIFAALPQPASAGTYALIGPQGYSGSLPPGAIPISMPVDHPTIIFRADKYSASQVDQTSEANSFRLALKIQNLSGYVADPAGGGTELFRQPLFAFPFKSIADGLVALDPITFLKTLAVAVQSGRTPPKTAADAALAAHMNALLASGVSRSALAAGTQAAHTLILDSYLDHTDAANWITFTNIGHWTAEEILDRASITEFLQYGNDRSAAGYYHVFRDGSGRPLDGSVTGQYTMTFPAGSIPSVKRFWSITAYTPQAIELVPNPLAKYDVASYTPGLQFSADGSLTLYFGVTQPAGVPVANYLPIPPRGFNLMLRFYGPTPGGSVDNNTYTPPPIVARD